MTTQLVKTETRIRGSIKGQETKAWKFFQEDFNWELECIIYADEIEEQETLYKKYIEIRKKIENDEYVKRLDKFPKPKNVEANNYISIRYYKNNIMGASQGLWLDRD